MLTETKKSLKEIRDELLKSNEFKQSQDTSLAYANGVLDMYNEVKKNDYA